MENFIDVLNEELNKAIVEKEVPIAAIVEKEGIIIAKAHNTRIRDNNVLSHAEVNCILEAERILGDWRLNGCNMYVTLEPCDMCKSIIKEARLDNVFYIIKRQENKKQYDKTNICMIKNIDNNFVKNYKEILSNFFKLNGKR